MKLDQFPKDIRDNLVPEPSGSMFYRCLKCQGEFAINNLIYVCPTCSGILMLHHKPTEETKVKDGNLWKKLGTAGDLVMGVYAEGALANRTVFGGHRAASPVSRGDLGPRET